MKGSEKTETIIQRTKPTNMGFQPACLMLDIDKPDPTKKSVSTNNALDSTTILVVSCSGKLM
jgi:hypothetical protein